MTWEVVMRVKFVQSGGVVGAVRGCELDSALLPPDEARELETLVRASGLAASGEFITSAARDMRRYEIRLESASENWSVTFDDGTVPERARPLVSYLRQNAKPRGSA